ncbi:MAG: hypothetical protein ACOCRO_04170 [Halanaerobiales bacterium]
MSKNREKRNRKRNLDNKEFVNEDLLVRAPALNPDDIEIGDEITPEDRLSAKNKKENEE